MLTNPLGWISEQVCSPLETADVSPCHLFCCQQMCLFRLVAAGSKHHHQQQTANAA